MMEHDPLLGDPQTRREFNANVAMTLPATMMALSLPRSMSAGSIPDPASTDRLRRVMDEYMAMMKAANSMTPSMMQGLRSQNCASLRHIYTAIPVPPQTSMQFSRFRGIYRVLMERKLISSIIGKLHDGDWEEVEECERVRLESPEPDNYAYHHERIARLCTGEIERLAGLLQGLIATKMEETHHEG